MTHEELLAKVDHMWNDDFDYVASCHTNALRAVVELHKPDKCGDCCITCEGEWPCITYDAIEKELN